MGRILLGIPILLAGTPDTGEDEDDMSEGPEVPLSTGFWFHSDELVEEGVALNPGKPFRVST